MTQILVFPSQADVMCKDMRALAETLTQRFSKTGKTIQIVETPEIWGQKVAVGDPDYFALEFVFCDGTQFHSFLNVVEAHAHLQAQMRDVPVIVETSFDRIKGLRSSFANVLLQDVHYLSDWKRSSEDYARIVASIAASKSRLIKTWGVRHMQTIH